MEPLNRILITLANIWDYVFKDIDSFEEIITLVKDITSILAIVIGGIWGYRVFILNRQKYPRANIDVSFFTLKILPGKILLRANLTICNIGNVLLSLNSIETFVHQVIPLSDSLHSIIKDGKNPVHDEMNEIAWPCIENKKDLFNKGDFEIEPGERQEFQFDFILSESIRVISFYVYVSNIMKRKKKIGWDKTIMYQMTGDGGNKNGQKQESKP